MSDGKYSNDPSTAWDDVLENGLHCQTVGLTEPLEWPWGGTRGWFTNSYPVLSPYSSIWTVDPNWIDFWIMQPYQGMW